jgi:type IV pilus assembly protein PilC
MEPAPQKSPARATLLMVIYLVVAVGSLCEIFINGINQSDAASIIAIALFVFCFFGLITASVRLFWIDPQNPKSSSLRGVVLIVSSIVFWSVAVGLGLLFIGFIVSLVEPAAGPVIVYALAFAVIILVAVNTAGQIVRRRRMLLILSNLEKAAQLNLPVPRMVLAAATGETGMLRMRLMALHDHLDRGEPLDQALLHSVPEIPRHVVRAIASGERMNCLPHVLTRLIRHRTEQAGPYAQTFGIYRAYPIVFFAVLLVVLIYVIPKFEGIFHDFRLDIPQPTILLVSSSPLNTVSWVLLIAIAIVPISQAIQSMFPSFRKISPFGGSLTDQLVWWLPVAGGYVRDRGMADLCDLTSVGIEMGHPLDQTLRDTAAAQPNAVMRNRTAAWAAAVAQGQPIHVAARHARFPDLFVGMLATVRDSAGLLQVLEFLFRHYEYRFVRTRALLQASYVPIIVFLMGTMVALLGVALMKPLALLSEHIAVHVSGGF